MIDTSSKKLNDVEDDDVVVIDGVEARVEAVAEGEVKAVVEGEIMAEGQVDQQALVEVQVEVEVQVGEQGLVKVQVGHVGETTVQAQMAAGFHVHE